MSGNDLSGGLASNVMILDNANDFPSLAKLLFITSFYTIFFLIEVEFLDNALRIDTTDLLENCIRTNKVAMAYCILLSGVDELARKKQD